LSFLFKKNLENNPGQEQENLIR